MNTPEKVKEISRGLGDCSDKLTKVGMPQPASELYDLFYKLNFEYDESTLDYVLQTLPRTIEYMEFVFGQTPLVKELSQILSEFKEFSEKEFLCGVYKLKELLED